MIILEKPYTSAELADYLEQSQTPVLDNAEARHANRNSAFNLMSDGEFARLVDAGKRLYTTSENALDWVGANKPTSPFSAPSNP